MSKRAVAITLSVVFGIVLIAGVGLFAYDATQKNHIAKGVEVGGVAVGGMTKDAARAKLQAAYLDPLEKPVVVKIDGRKFHLTARQSEIKANIDAMVDEALAQSRTGNPWSRAVRDITGGTVDANLKPEVTYSKASVDALVERIRTRINRKPKDASVSFGADGLSAVPAQSGLQLKVTSLKKKLDAALISPDSSRVIKAGTWKKTPTVTTSEAEKQYETAIVVDRSAFTLKLYKNLKLFKTYDVAVGAEGRDTPAGLYHIQNKAVDPDWNVPYSDWTGDMAGQVVPGGSPQNPLKARWLGIIDGAGIHGVDPSEYGTIGSAASHGCVRMRIDDVIDLYDRVPVGAPIYIV
jgi:lipoprotein-anchoring transpeptidase ErfK/SrfK